MHVCVGKSETGKSRQINTSTTKCPSSCLGGVWAACRASCLPWSQLPCPNASHNFSTSLACWPTLMLCISTGLSWHYLGSIASIEQVSTIVSGCDPVVWAPRWEMCCIAGHPDTVWPQVQLCFGIGVSVGSCRCRIVNMTYSGIQILKQQTQETGYDTMHPDKQNRVVCRRRVFLKWFIFLWTIKLWRLIFISSFLWLWHLLWFTNKKLKTFQCFFLIWVR